MAQASIPTERKIIHSDCDCFYAAIETRDDPRLLGRPLAVGGRPDQRGVVASCNYEARASGVRSAMPMARAVRLCPDLVILRPAMEKYRAASRQILAIYARYTALVEPLSLDEAYLDVSGARHCRGSATLMAREIKAQVRDAVGITVSAGVAPNKFLAKVASAWSKPDGLFVIEPEAVAAFVAELPVERLLGVGAVTAAKLRAHGIVTCSDVQKRSRLELRALVGTLGDRLCELAQGVDPRAVVSHRERKSLSVEETYANDLKDLDACRAELRMLVLRLQAAAVRLKPHELIERTFVKLRFDDFRKTSVERGAARLELSQFMELLETGHARARRPVRLLGVGARIAPAATGLQLPLFDAETENAQSFQGNPT